ncbi:uncharacterized protein LOC115795386 [Archocentrus centrarchus]|uniref:uncharacterized protein LOC115782528 n=2 Tax=Archocentrus centrarchus TaxID=63155 RepID=UPI0011E9B7E5|nr:uncharacterized protein LOC115782528 [Archocentrus centrarchus]XP_030588592.1 uncharacterized protein LOC115782528 [Archocentrus centrarchus]XP_030588593.1 uncharacterized protein LOC115782528 [Archocentrus centrarchus]XP_030607130.1 uncharacterized protein LOC115795386 [Archocentrus centrarchus]XP_030607131.1 uncharacterized protein LOC115795386 [Archocentrus centrarchus]XP_030607132.1 uncharacterized protein LOC115795386 [Archocentrus centrarchus]
MFHQFFVPPAARNYLRFLWWGGADLEAEPQEYRMTVHPFGATSSPGCANFGLKYLAQKHTVDYPLASAFIEKNFYVDDGLTSVPSVKDAEDLIIEARELCKKGGLRLHKFNSNRLEVLDCVDASERATKAGSLHLGLDEPLIGRALGIQWSIEQDSFSFDVNLKNQPSSRRGILSVIASIYDPLGFISPVTLCGKRILQDLCRQGAGWDEPLPEDLGSRWEEWKGDLPKLQEIIIPRCYHPPEFKSIVRIELHHFSDASSVGYGACSYVRYINNDREVYCSLVMAKARVAPTKLLSIPRMELSAAVVSARMSAMLRVELEMKIDEEFFWTDSQVVLAYINNDVRRFHVFVANRLQVIKGETNCSQWHFVDTSENPADHASRGLNASGLLSTNWMMGPSFLWQHELKLTSPPSAVLLVRDPEVRAAQVNVAITSDCDDMLDRLSRFSSWIRLLKVVARIRRMTSRQRHDSDHITVEEIESATEVVVRLVQQQAFSEERRTLEKGDSLPHSSPLFRFNPILDKGILRVGGRLRQSSLSQGLKHPIILPKSSHITELVLLHFHERICHQGRSQTQMELRANGFWVIGGSKSTARLIHHCVTCRKLRRPAEEQQMAELPEARVEASAPFTYCGMDVFGPFIIKRARTEHKRYGLIFTCLSSRAIHIETLEDLSTDAFINALRCFISLRGAVRQLYCDHGTNFVGARNEFKKALKQCDPKKLEAYLANKQCEFIFSAPAASHAGGVWERQIRTVRNVLNATLCVCPGRLDDFSLRTLFYEAMAIVNSRPLNVDGINDPRSLEPLTPNHLILMKSQIALPPAGKFVREDVYATKRWRRVQYLTEQFWGRWKREYLLNISLRQKWHKPRRNLKTNDIVIVIEDTLPRNQWQLGRVVETIQGTDKLVRRVRVQVTDRRLHGKSDPPFRTVILERPIQKLVLLLGNE